MPFTQWITVVQDYKTTRRKVAECILDVSVNLVSCVKSINKNDVKLRV
jgi:hypothetical protein